MSNPIQLNDAEQFEISQLASAIIAGDTAGELDTKADAAVRRIECEHGRGGAIEWLKALLCETKKQILDSIDEVDQCQK